MAVTPAEYALLSNAVYQDRKTLIPPEYYGFERIVRPDPKQAFYGEAWRRGDDLVIVFRGTANWENIKHDAAMWAAGKQPPEYEAAYKFFESVEQYCKENNLSVSISMTGHSLGGGEVQYVDAKLTKEKGYQVPGVAFAPAGAGDFFPGIDRSSIAVTNYMHIGDEVPETMNKHLGTCDYLPAVGNKYEVQYNSHGVGEIVSTPDSGVLAQHRMLGYLVDLGRLPARELPSPQNTSFDSVSWVMGNSELGDTINTWQKEHPGEARKLNAVISEAYTATRDAKGNIIADQYLQRTYAEKIEKAFEESGLAACINKAAGVERNIGAQPNIHDMLMLVQKRQEEVEKLAKEREKYQGEPLTEKQAERRAVNEYTKGESEALAANRQSLEREIGKYNEGSQWTENFSKSLGWQKYLPDFLIRNPFMREGVQRYEDEAAKLSQWNKELSQRAEAHDTNYQQLQTRLHMPEARAAIDKQTKEYLAQDEERLAKLAHVEGKLDEAQKEKANSVRQAVGTFTKWGNSTPEQDAATWQRVADIMNVQSNTGLCKENQEYRIQAKAIIERQGYWPGQAADMDIAQRMAAKGFSAETAKWAVVNNSPETAGMTFDAKLTYGRDITAQFREMGHVVHAGRGLQL